MEKHKPLTIDIPATKARIKADGRTVSSWGMLRSFSFGTISRIFGGTYRHQENVDSVYQQVLRQLKTDGYLVQQGEQQNIAA